MVTRGVVEYVSFKMSKLDWTIFEPPAPIGPVSCRELTGWHPEVPSNQCDGMILCGIHFFVVWGGEGSLGVVPKDDTNGSKGASKLWSPEQTEFSSTVSGVYMELRSAAMTVWVGDGQEDGEYPSNSEYVVISSWNKEEFGALQKAHFSLSEFLYLSKIWLLLMKKLRVGFSGPNWS